VAFTLLPAIDVAGGRLARVGDNEVCHLPAEPLDAALVFQADGAEWVHLVDIDAAFGRGTNTDLVAAIVGNLDINVELSEALAALSS
jgi:phosphoribosyl isomerase A